MSAGHPKASVL